MEIAGLIIGWLLLGLGVLGCFINKIPGPLLAFLGLLIQMWMCNVGVEMWALILTAVLVVVSMVQRNLFPKSVKWFQTLARLAVGVQQSVHWSVCCSWL